MTVLLSDGRSKISPRYSPDSVITQGTKFSAFSSATASIGRSSYESDGREHDSSVAVISKHLAGRDRKGASRALDLDPNRDSVTKSNHGDDGKKDTARRGEEADATEYSFSDALKDCQKRRVKPEKTRTNSLDLINPAFAHESPRLNSMVLHHQQQHEKQKSSVSSRKSTTSGSPDTPSLRTVLTQQKGTTGARRALNVPAGQIYPGKSLPSKWEDAEKWIFSPGSNEAPSRPSIVQPRKAKSKSGPLAVMGSGYRPSVPVPSTARVLATTQFHQFSQKDEIEDAGSKADSYSELCIARSASVHGCSDLVMQTTEAPERHPMNMNTKPDGTKDAATMISPAVSRRDMATQMSPSTSSIHSSPRKGNSSPSSLHPPVLTIMELQKIRQLSKFEVRDVEMDDRISTTSRRSKRLVDRLSIDVADWNKKNADSGVSTWEVLGSSKRTFKCKKEEAKITAWENLQKAKAEAEIRKLEAKLEKLRSSSMEKIMNKLRSAQKKAHEMRVSVSALPAQHLSRTAQKARSIHRAAGRMGPLGGCFMCHAS